MHRLRLLPMIVLASCVSSSAFGAEPGPAAAPHHPMGMEVSSERHEAMMEEMRAQQARLDERVAAMEAAQGAEKVDAIAAVVKELVAQRRTRIDRMQEMHERMMESMREGTPQGEPLQPGHEHPSGERP